MGNQYFPYPEIKDEYYHNTKDPKLKINNPLIKLYNNEEWIIGMIIDKKNIIMKKT